MANVAHSGLTGSNLHENKGVTSATDNTVATAVSGATVWAKLTASNLTGTGNAFGAQLFHAQNQQASGTAGGSLSNSITNVRTLNTAVTTEVGSLASNQVTLTAGTYYMEAQAMTINDCGGSQLFWYNVTDGAYTLKGMCINAGGTGVGLMLSISGRFTIAGTKVFELRQWASSAHASGQGLAASSSQTGVFADLKVWKVA